MTSLPIACELHDYIEIACLYRYRVELHLKNGETLEGRAVDVVTQDRREYLILEADQRRTVELNDLVKLRVLTPGAKFSEVTFV